MDLTINCTHPQDIKDHLREAGDVYYAEVYGDGTGIVEFARQKDVDTAIEKLDNTKFKSHEVFKHLQFVLSDFLVCFSPLFSGKSVCSSIVIKIGVS